MDDFQCKVAISSHTHHESGQWQLADEQIDEEATERKRALMYVFQKQQCSLPQCHGASAHVMGKFGLTMSHYSASITPSCVTCIVPFTSLLPQTPLPGV